MKEKYEDPCEKQVEPLSQAINQKFGVIQNIISENSEYIQIIHEKLDPILFQRTPSTSGGSKGEEECQVSNSIWMYFDETVYILEKQKREIMALYERIEG